MYETDLKFQLLYTIYGFKEKKVSQWDFVLLRVNLSLKI